jgi:hypothetical protein
MYAAFRLHSLLTCIIQWVFYISVLLRRCTFLRERSPCVAAVLTSRSRLDQNVAVTCRENPTPTGCIAWQGLISGVQDVDWVGCHRNEFPRGEAEASPGGCLLQESCAAGVESGHCGLRSEVGGGGGFSVVAAPTDGYWGGLKSRANDRTSSWRGLPMRNVGSGGA